MQKKNQNPNKTPNKEDPPVLYKELGEHFSSWQGTFQVRLNPQMLVFLGAERLYGL